MFWHMIIVQWLVIRNVMGINDILVFLISLHNGIDITPLGVNGWKKNKDNFTLIRGMSMPIIQISVTTV